MNTALLSVNGLTKAYPGVVANSDVTLEIQPGEIHALLGENGAGKSTLVKMIYGLVKPDSGHMEFKGKNYSPQDPRTARATGVGMVFQHFSLFDALTVAENISLGMENAPPMGQLAQKISEISENYGLPLSPERYVTDLSAGERQRVEIIRCLLQDPKLLIMDEPTSVLTPQEVDILFQTLNKLRAEGTSILYISHKLEEIRALCDGATVLRHGQVVGECTPAQTTAREMAEMMVGSEMSTPKRSTQNLGDVVLKVTNLSRTPATDLGVPLRDISFDLHRGEVLGIGGVAGNGQDELLDALFGECDIDVGMITYKGNDMAHLGVNDRREMGMLCAPEERLGHAAAPDMSLLENAMLTAAQRENLEKRGMLDWTSANAFAKRIIEEFDVRTPGTGSAARSLSGGNLQKFVIGREVLQRPDVLIVNQPTWGVDASAAASIRQALMDLTKNGGALVVVSQDLDELMEISDRFCALNEGRLSAPRPTSELNVEEIGLMLGGAHDMEVAHV